MIELHKHLEFFALLGTQRAVVLLSEQLGHTLLRCNRWTKGSEFLGSCGICNELDNFLKGFHEPILKRQSEDFQQRLRLPLPVESIPSLLSLVQV